MQSPEGVRVVMLGTMHISRASVVHARQVVAREQPACVFVELCRERSRLLGINPDQPLAATKLSLSQVSEYIMGTWGWRHCAMGVCVWGGCLVWVVLTAKT